MKIDNTSMFFNASIKDGTATAAWATSAGQSQKNGYKINYQIEGLLDLIIGMNYKICSDSINLDISSGSKSRELLYFSVFDKVFINNIYLEHSEFILLFTKEHSSSHDGRILISYPPYAKYVKDGISISNSDTITRMATAINCADGCWFVYDISVINQDELHFNAIVVDNSRVEYNSSEERKILWDKLVLDNSDIKEQFKTYLLEIHKLKTLKTANEYINTFPKVKNWFLENHLVKSDFYIWDINNDLSKIKESLEGSHKDAWQSAAQKNELGDGGFMMASWNRWNEFIDWKKSILIQRQPQEFDFKDFESNLINSGLIFSEQLILRYVSSLCSKPFVICSGLSGSGKTKLAQAFAQWISIDETQYLIIPVGADWTNREPILGYPNAIKIDEYVKPENGALDLLLRAKRNFEDASVPNKPYFLILDEMNLSHVERYFADFLSAMESGEPIHLHNIGLDSYEDSNSVPNSVILPKNLFIIGTVNIDETTYMFSPKVLDRANTIEFRLSNSDLNKYLDSNIKLNLDLLKGQGANMAESFISFALKETGKNLVEHKNDLILFFSELKKSGAEFGYRTASEIGRLMYMLEEFGEKGDDLLDVAIMQKLLPKLHGSRNKLSKVLPVLGSFCLKNNVNIKEEYFDKYVANIISEKDIENDPNVKYRISLDKICRMYKNAIENGFASYAEA